jgi:hypothetical protein
LFLLILFFSRIYFLCNVIFNLLNYDFIVNFFYGKKWFQKLHFFSLYWHRFSLDSLKLGVNFSFVCNNILFQEIEKEKKNLMRNSIVIANVILIVSKKSCRIYFILYFYFFFLNKNCQEFFISAWKIVQKNMMIQTILSGRFLWVFLLFTVLHRLMIDFFGFFKIQPIRSKIRNFYFLIGCINFCNKWLGADFCKFRPG